MEVVLEYAAFGDQGIIIDFDPIGTTETNGPQPAMMPNNNCRAWIVDERPYRIWRLIDFDIVTHDVSTWALYSETSPDIKIFTILTLRLMSTNLIFQNDLFP